MSAAGKASRSFDLDFLRGLFVLGILVYHLVPGAPVGLGQGSMEGFFCLSGFLITRTLLRRIPRGWPGLGDFAVNRLRRLMPALLLYLGLVGFLNLWFARADFGLVLNSTAASILGFYNWFQINQGQALQGLGGIWSLSVEDQFYMIVMAAAAVLIYAKKTGKTLTLFLVLYIGFLILSLGVRLGNQFWWPWQSSEMISYSTFSRLWSFGWGGLVALIKGSEILKNIPFLISKIFLSPHLWLVISVLAACSARTYNASAFLGGWLVCGVAIGLCILSVNCKKEKESSVFKNLPTAGFIAKTGIACYPIYLFQAFEKNLAISLPWPISFLLACMLGFLIHAKVEKRFYKFN